MDRVEPGFCVLVFITIKYYKLSFGFLKLSNYSWGYQPMRGEYFVNVIINIGSLSFFASGLVVVSNHLEVNKINDQKSRTRFLYTTWNWVKTIYIIVQSTPATADTLGGRFNVRNSACERKKNCFVSKNMKYTFCCSFMYVKYTFIYVNSWSYMANMRSLALPWTSLTRTKCIEKYTNYYVGSLVRSILNLLSRNEVYLQIEKTI